MCADWADGDRVVCSARSDDLAYYRCYRRIQAWNGIWFWHEAGTEETDVRTLIKYHDRLPANTHTSLSTQLIELLEEARQAGCKG